MIGAQTVVIVNRQRSKSRRLLLICSSTAALLLLLAGGKERSGTSNAGTLDVGTLPVVFAASLGEDPCTAPGADEQEAQGGPAAMGGDLSPVRYVVDPYPTFNGIALDLQTNRVVLSDENRKSVLTYDRTAGSSSTSVTPPVRQIMGPQTEIGYISGIELDPAHRELYAVNNDIEDRIAVFGYDANGDLKPKRHLYVPHQTWGISLNPAANEIAVSVQQLAMVAIYRREASGLEAPVRMIKGTATGMADPHGVRWDAAHHEIAVANHGNYSVITPYSAYDATGSNTALSVGGHFLMPSITVFADSAKGDVKPIRTIQGARTRLNWPMGIDIDTTHDEIAVANNGDNSVLVFHRGAQGDVAPVRIIHGARTGIAGPMGVVIDPKNDELWVANYADHTALVFSRTATGDAAPKRIIRNAPGGTPTGGFGNPYAVAYDSKREQLLVPN
jgi:DNA-binding beta-propeller fold protein YncE